VNDSAGVLGELFNNLSYAGVPPYYVFQCRPTAGNRHFVVPVERVYKIHNRAKMKSGGLAKRSRYIISHSSGKIEVVGLTPEHIIFKHHSSPMDEDQKYVSVFRRNPEAVWYDDYLEQADEGYEYEREFCELN
jgi:L-lysine 2,3-aminomutase